MNKEFVPYDIALALKELGFDEPCICCYIDEDCGVRGHISFSFDSFECKQFIDDNDLKRNSQYNESITAPLYQQAFRWFRERGLVGYLVPLFNEKHWKFGTGTGKIDNRITCNPIAFNSYEQAQNACLRKLIEIVKNK